MAEGGSGGGAMDPLQNFEIHPIVEIQLGGLDLSITQPVLWMMIAVAVVFGVLTFVASTLKRSPKGLQNFIEMTVDFLRKDLVHAVVGEEGKNWFPFIATLFLFIATCNLLGLIPGSFTATSNINVTASLAIMVFVFVQFAGIKKKGLIGYAKGLVPSGIPKPILVIMIPIEIVSLLVKPFSLAVRLFANMLAGHMVIYVFLGMIILFKSVILTPLPFMGVVIMYAFEIFVALIQAYIFAVLTASYLSDALHEGH
ncbi:ATP synthase F0 sector subunit a [hydrothermal vent metagenome]|uniref:ATP synthase F0 sector subunit a n=1 Tax=hydrothermal vent metagenome TaxID=652676 RepID=A0A3B1DBS1_9ZZZZ